MLEINKLEFKITKEHTVLVWLNNKLLGEWMEYEFTNLAQDVVRLQGNLNKDIPEFNYLRAPDLTKEKK